MTDLLLCIASFNALLVLFKFFNRYGVDNLQAIVVNYAVAGVLGLLHAGGFSRFGDMIDSDWIWYAVFIGVFFILTFLLLAVGTQKIGMAISTVANKMSLIIPVSFAFVWYGDEVTILKLFGILMALGGVFLTSTTADSLSFDKKFLWMILVIFAGQGIADVIFNYAQQEYVTQADSGLFICGMFFAAGLAGLFFASAQVLTKRSKLNPQAVLWGITLGVPNYLTVYFFFCALESSSLDSTQVYPIYNIGVILLSALIGAFIFSEKLSARNWIGVGLSAMAIAAIGLG